MPMARVVCVKWDHKIKKIEKKWSVLESLLPFLMYSVIRLPGLWVGISDVISFVLCVFCSLPLCLQVRTTDAHGTLTMFLIHRLLFLTSTRHCCLPFPTFLTRILKEFTLFSVSS